MPSDKTWFRKKIDYSDQIFTLRIETSAIGNRSLCASSILPSLLTRQTEWHFGKPYMMKFQRILKHFVYKRHRNWATEYILEIDTTSKYELLCVQIQLDFITDIQQIITDLQISPEYINDLEYADGLFIHTTTNFKH